MVFDFVPLGGAKGSRTPDLLNAIQTRYQLRYNPKKEKRLFKAIFPYDMVETKGLEPPTSCM